MRELRRGAKNRVQLQKLFCLSCAKGYADHWVEFIGRRLFPGVVYRHIVLTVPKYLRLWFYRNPQLLSPLMRAGHACLRDVFSTCSHVDLDIGSVSVLQTNGRPGTTTRICTSWSPQAAAIPRADGRSSASSPSTCCIARGSIIC